MSESKHTPGPWRRCGGSTASYIAVHSDRGYIVLGMADRSQREGGRAIQAPPDDEQLANARLIAAAPQLLWALKAVLACEIRHDENGHAYIHVHARSIFDLPAQIREIIEQAEGTK